jgi:integrase
MSKGKLTKRSVDALRCPSGRDRTFRWDGSLSGFGVAAFASGKKAYVVQYRQNGASRRMTLGQHGRITCDEARSIAKRVLGAVETGADPIGERKGARGERTFKELSDEFLRLHVATKRKRRTLEEYARILKLHLLPAFGSRRVSEIRKADVTRLHAKLADRKAVANRSLALVSSIWNWAASRDEVSADKNPAKGLEHYPEKSSERFLSSNELARLGDALRLAETTGLPWNIDESKPGAKHIPKRQRATKLDPHAVAAIRLLILTGSRLREILHAKWDYVNWERGLLLLPDSKTGKKTVYLSAPALAVLGSLVRVEGNPYIIAGMSSADRASGNDGYRADLQKPWAAVQRAAGLEGVRLHDLRHSFAATGAGSSLGLPMIGKLLGHSQPSTTARYAHLDADPMHRAANVIGNQIASVMAGHPGSSVVTLPKRR